MLLTALTNMSQHPSAFMLLAACLRKVSLWPLWPGGQPKGSWQQGTALTIQNLVILIPFLESEGVIYPKVAV
jgi:hypothetical protein